MKCYKLLTALRTFFAVVFVIVPVSSFASRKTEEAKFLTPARLYYLSPKIADGNTDILEIDLSSTVKPGKGRSFVESVFTIYDISGHIIFEQKTALNKAKKLQQLSYDGKDTQGHYLPDGLYVFTIKTKDDKNNESSSQPFSLMVDNVPPEIRSVKFVTGNVIVPSSDTNVAISIDGTPEILWEVYAVSAASGKTPVFSQKSNSPQSPPQGWSWNGTDLTGSNIAGGSYALEIRAQDGAGNSAEFALETKLIVSTEGALTLSSELSAVSPNDDGIMDRALLTVSGDPSLLQSFTSTQIMAASVDQNRFTQNVAAIDGNINELYFEGKDQFGFVFKDGMYEIFVQLTTSSGDVYITNKLMFTVDTTPPAIAFAVQTSPHATPVDDPLYFGGEKRTKLTGVFSVSDAQAATELKILYGDQEILNKQLPNSPQPIPFTIPADFQIEEAQQLQDGLYTAILSAQDSAGNKAEHPPIKVFSTRKKKHLN